MYIFICFRQICTFRWFKRGAIRTVFGKDVFMTKITPKIYQKYGKQIGEIAKNGTIALKKTINGEDVVTVVNTNDGQVVKTVRSKIYVLWNGIISKYTSIYNSSGKCTDFLSTSFNPHWGNLEVSHFKYGDVKKEIRSEVYLNDKYMSFKQKHFTGDMPYQTIVRTVIKNNIKIKNPNFRYATCGPDQLHNNKYANEIYKSAGSKYYNEWIS